MARRGAALAILVFGLSACGRWNISLTPYLSPQPSSTHTPLILPFTPIPSTPTATLPPATETEPPTPSPTFTPTPTVRIETVILGCNTSLDITHGLGEVTNAFITISNTGELDLSEVCAALKALDEGQPHPDKTKCILSLPAGYQTTLKLTVDTTYKKETPIQIEVTSTLGLLQRVGREACTEIGRGLSLDDLGTPRPIPKP